MSASTIIVAIKAATASVLSEERLSLATFHADDESDVKRRPVVRRPPGAPMTVEDIDNVTSITFPQVLQNVDVRRAIEGSSGGSG